MVGLAGAQTSLNNNTFGSSAGYLKILPDLGYILVFYTDKQDKFWPTKFLIIFKKPMSLEVELINGVGRESVVILRDEEAANYLKNHQINLDKLDEIFKHQYCR